MQVKNPLLFCLCREVVWHCIYTCLPGLESTGPYYMVAFKRRKWQKHFCYKNLFPMPYQ